MTLFPDAKGRDSKCDFASFFTTNVFISITQTHAHFYKSVVIRNKNDYSIRTKATERIEWMQKRQSGNKNVKKRTITFFLVKKKIKFFFSAVVAVTKTRDSSIVIPHTQINSISFVFNLLPFFFLLRCISNSVHLVLFSVTFFEDISLCVMYPYGRQVIGIDVWKTATTLFVAISLYHRQNNNPVHCLLRLLNWLRYSHSVHLHWILRMFFFAWKCY